MISTISKEELFSFGPNVSSVIIFKDPSCLNCPDMVNFFNDRIIPNIESKQLDIYTVDVDSEIISRFNITKTPVVGMFKDGIEYYTSVGLHDVNENNDEETENFLFYVNGLFKDN